MAAAEGKLSPEDNVKEDMISSKDYLDPPPTPLFDAGELGKWSLYRAVIAEFTATLLFVYVAVATVIGHKRQTDTEACSGAGVLGIAWAFGGMIAVLVYCTAGISGGHINPAVTFGLLLSRKVSLPRAFLYMAAQCLGAICGAALVRAVHGSHHYALYGGGANELAPGFSKSAGLVAEALGTAVLVYTVFSATDPKRMARDSHIPVLAPLLIGFAVMMVHLATIPVTGTGINPARSLGAAVVYNGEKAWDDQWIFWVGPFLGAATGKSGAAVQHIIAVRHRTATLPCAARGTHGKEYVHGKVTGWRTAKIQSTATSPVPHGNIPSHGKVPQTRTAKKP